MSGRMGWIVLGFVLLFPLVTWGVFAVYQQNDNKSLQTARTELAILTDNKTSEYYQIGESMNLTAESFNLTAPEKLALVETIRTKENSWGQLWAFCGTETFKTIVISFLLGTILTALGGILKLDTAIEERVRQARQERINAQRECIEKTAQMWNGLNRLVTKVRYLTLAQAMESSTKNRKPIIDSLCEDLQNYSTKVEEVATQWVFMFPLLPKTGEELKKEIIVKNKNVSTHKLVKEYRLVMEYLGLYVALNILHRKFVSPMEVDTKGQLELLMVSKQIRVFVDFLFNCSASIVHYVKSECSNHTNDKNDLELPGTLKSMQESLGIIQDVIKDLAYQPIFSILRSAVESIEGNKRNKMSQSIIRHYMKVLFYSTELVKLIQYKDQPWTKLVDITQPYAKEFYQKAGKLYDWEIRDDNFRINTRKNYHEYSVIQSVFDQNIQQKNVREWGVYYSKDFLEKAANELRFYSVTIGIMDRATWHQKAPDS
jgi:hypothetical protein